ncbi:MAG: FIST C-terminal domain-containing protein [Christensenellaceae bacterium]|nr:FIST C-terminal domain-containing protein [Christensenellaceae bacterium]
MKSFVVYTKEIDNIDGAVTDISKQITDLGGIPQNSVGVILCHYEFIFSGVMSAVCKSLTFPIVGTITSTQGINNNVAEMFVLSVLIFSGDDITIKTGLTDSLTENPYQKIKDKYLDIAIPGKKPALILSYAGFMTMNSGDEYVRTISEVSGGAPVFGTLAVDDTTDFSCCFMIYNGDHYIDRMGLILIYGDIHPEFYTAIISPEKIFPNTALITSATGHIMKEVNNRPVTEFFAELNLTTATQTPYAMTSLPLVLDFNDGTPMVARMFISLTPNNEALCAADMTEGSTLYIGITEKADVLHTTTEVIKKALAANKKPSIIFAYSCIARNMTLDGDMYAEINAIQKIIGDVPMFLGYSGGEICPTQVKNNESINRFHNSTFILCVI